MLAVPTTAGTGSETTTNAIVELEHGHVKAAVSSPRIRPTLAFIDPANVVTCPPAVTAATGYDVLVQAIESFTSKPFDRRAAPQRAADRPTFAGANPITDMWSERAIALAAASLRRSIADGSDLEARTGMCLAAMFGRYGNAGVHIPHACAYSVASFASGYRAAGYGAARDFVPHGYTVAVMAPAAFEFTFAGAPRTHLRAAEILGVPAETRRPSRAPPSPAGFAPCSRRPAVRQVSARWAFSPDVPAMAAYAAEQTRLSLASPRPAPTETSSESSPDRCDPGCPSPRVAATKGDDGR